MRRLEPEVKDLPQGSYDVRCALCVFRPAAFVTRSLCRRAQVALPPGEDLSEWLAVNTVDFYNAVNLLYNTLAEFCTAETCATMSAGPKYEYRWADGVKVRGKRAPDDPPTTTARPTEPGRVRGRLIHLRRRAKFDC